MKTFMKKTLITFLIICILLPSLFSNISSGEGFYLTQERAGNYMANFAINYYENWNSETKYGVAGRNAAYLGNKTGNYYEMDCVGWISFVAHQSLGIGGNSFTVFVAPFVTGSARASNGFEIILGDLAETQENEGEIKTNLNIEKSIAINVGEKISDGTIKPGDILIKSLHDSESSGSGHVLLYVGAGKIIDCIDTGNKAEALQYKHISELNYDIGGVARITSQTAESILDENVSLIFNGKGWINANKQNYIGVPSKGTYAGSSNLIIDSLNWVIDRIGDILDYLIGIFFYSIKVQLIGWTYITENIINNAIITLTQETKKDFTQIEIDPNEKSIDITRIKSSKNTINVVTGRSEGGNTERITIESLIFNRIPIFDVNIFSSNIAGGMEIKEDSTVYIVRDNIAKWYYILRQFTIILMLIILLYIGIRIAIASTGTKKAIYKQALKGWFIGIAVIFILHYFMIIIININQSLVGVFETAAVGVNQNEQSMYDTVLTKAYSLKFTEGLTGTIMYMYLVLLLVKYLYIYFKRYFAINILAVMAPFMGIKYALEKIKGKKVTALGGWMYDFAMNVLLQSVHALIYVTIMGIAINVATESFAGFVLALVFLNFILKADKLFMKIFNFDKSKTVGDTAKPESLLSIFKKGAVSVKVIGGIAPKIYKGGRNIVTTYKQDKYEYLDMVRGTNNARKIAEMEKFEKMGSIYSALSELPIFRLSSTIKAKSQLGKSKDYDINKKRYDAMKLDRQMRNRMFTRSITFGKDMAIGTAKMMAAIPVTIAEPSAGYSMFRSGMTQRAKYNGKKKYGYKKKLETHKGDKLNRIKQQYVESVMQYELAKEGYYDGKLTIGELERRMESDRIALYEETKKRKEEQVAGENLQKVLELGRETVGAGAAIGTGEAYNKFIKDSADNVRKIEKQSKKIDDLTKAQDIGSEIERLYDELKREEQLRLMSKGKTKEEAKDFLDKQVNRTVKEGLTQTVKRDTVEEAISEYIYKNSLSSIGSDDVDEILNVIEKKLGKNRVEFSSTVRDRIKYEIKAKINKNKDVGLDRKKAIDEIHKGVVKNDSVTPQFTKGIKDVKTRIRYEQMMEKIRELQVLNEKSKKRYGSSIVNINKFIGNMKKEK